jgi:hypothetical protein
VSAVCFCGPASAAALPLAGFRLPASNGYTILGLAADGTPAGKPDTLLLFVARKNAAVDYVVRRGVVVTEDSISAQLGALGSLDLRFEPTGHPKVDPSQCLRHPFESESGFFVGHFDFTGEEGFTEAHSTSARGDDELVADILCGAAVDEGFGGHSPGALLRVHRAGTTLTVSKNSPSRPARFTAKIREKINAMEVERTVSARANSSAFDFDVPSQSARLHPPAPFGGTARFLRSSGGIGRLEGNLEVDFPGRRGVSLAGTRGSLQRWVDNPGHPFRPR